MIAINNYQKFLILINIYYLGMITRFWS